MDTRRDQIYARYVSYKEGRINRFVLVPTSTYEATIMKEDKVTSSDSSRLMRARARAPNEMRPKFYRALRRRVTLVKNEMSRRTRSDNFTSR